MESLESLITGILSSTDGPNVQIRHNKTGLYAGQYSARVYAKDDVKTGHGYGLTLSEAVRNMAVSRMMGGGIVGDITDELPHIVMMISKTMTRE